jgi:hypothetical protein
MTQVFIPELIDGFWKNHRPAGHGDVWRDVEVKVSEDGKLGTSGFDTPRNYNFLNLDFALPNEARLVAVAQSAKSNSNFKSVKKELIELGRIVGNRLASRDATPVKLFRGNHKPGTETVSSARARAASAAMAAGAQAVVATPVEATAAPAGRKPTGPKRTVTKQKIVAQGAGQTAANSIKAKLATRDEAGVTVTKTSQGATVRRVAVSALPTAE